ncbi:MAG: cupin domain-containing protein [Chloroflexi bacterium]|nr:cupin domain-containing protein [Chloroflexota bacterium]
MPASAAATGAVVRRLQDTAGVPCSCGTAYRVIRAANGSPASVHFVDIRIDSDRHYHRTFTEIYTCLQGNGFLELDGSVVALTPGTVVVIPPGVRHRAYPASSDQTLRILNTAVPPFDTTDEWLD